MSTTLKKVGYGFAALVVAATYTNAHVPSFKTTNVGISQMHQAWFDTHYNTFDLGLPSDTFSAHSLSADISKLATNGMYVECMQVNAINASYTNTVQVFGSITLKRPSSNERLALNIKSLYNVEDGVEHITSEVEYLENLNQETLGCINSTGHRNEFHSKLVMTNSYQANVDFLEGKYPKAQEQSTTITMPVKREWYMKFWNVGRNI